MNPSRTQNRGEKGLSAGGGVEVDGGDEAVAGVRIGLEASRGYQGAEATAGRGFGAVAERGVVVDGNDSSAPTKPPMRSAPIRWNATR